MCAPRISPVCGIRPLVRQPRCFGVATVELMFGIAFGVQGKHVGVRSGRSLIDWMQAIAGVTTIIEFARCSRSC